MASVLSQRKSIELREKLLALEKEFGYWLDNSEKGKGFEKHHTQIRTVTRRLQRVRNLIQTEVEHADEEDRVLASSRNIEQLILAVFRIWEYFRRKFVQRRETLLINYLKAADEFAWACYDPVRRAAIDIEVKEPPLVFFNGGVSPFSVSRDRTFQPEEIPNELLTGNEFKKILQSLPIPVIGIPWSQVCHLPDAMVIAHEVGHTIEDDFGLTNEILTAIENSGIRPDQLGAWHSWTGEIFADFYGCLCGGPAFVATLVDVLAGDPARIVTEHQDDHRWRKYPPDALRVLINLAALEEIGFASQKATLEAAWRTIYPHHAMEAFEESINIFISTLSAIRFKAFGYKSLPELIKFSKEDYADAEREVRELIATPRPALTSQKFRVLFAAARLAYMDCPIDYVSRRFDEHILAAMIAATKVGTRAGETVSIAKATNDIDEKNMREGDSLFEKLQGLQQINLLSD